MIEGNLPALQVVLPLIATPLCVLLRRGALAWLITWSATWATAGWLATAPSTSAE